MGNPVVHFEISGRDGKKLIDFYSSIFGWNINDIRNRRINAEAER